MTDPLHPLRRQAKILHKQYDAGDRDAMTRVNMINPRAAGSLKHADFLHVIARENDFASWPQMKIAVETRGLDRAARVQRLRSAVAHGQVQVVRQMIADAPDLADGALDLEIALYDLAAVRRALADNPACATEAIGSRRPILHLAFSRMHQVWPEKQADTLAIAGLLLNHGADVNDSYDAGPNGQLSALYGALGFAGNLLLARFLLENGADPNDGESLYHATELGHRDGIRLLLEHGADPKGTNALLRAMDFHDVAAVRLLLDAGADPNAESDRPDAIPALIHAARRQSTAEMIDLLLDAGADPAQHWQEVTAYAAACVFGNDLLRDRLAALGTVPELTETEQILADGAQGGIVEGRVIDMAKVPQVFQHVLREVVALPGREAHVKALVAAGIPWDAPDATGLPPVQVAGWEGLPAMVAYFLTLGPDLNHVNRYGGTLLTTILHGSETCPARAERDHIGCLKLVLEHGAALPRRAIEMAGDPDMADFLADWAEAHPEQVVA